MCLQALQGSLYLPTTGVDLRSAGFRECAAEVARYLMSVEGMEPHEPLPVRLLTHLHNSLARKEHEGDSLIFFPSGANKNLVIGGNCCRKFMGYY